MTVTSEDAELAGRLATAAGELLLTLRADSSLTGKELGNAGDLQSNEFLLAELARLRPDDAVLSEESADDLVRLDADRVWIIDPVDGTKEYGIEGHTDWAVHVALWEREAGGTSGGLTAGAVALPALGVTYIDDGAPIAPADGLASQPRGDRPRVVVSGSRPPAFSGAVAEAIGGDVLAMGSAGAKAMAVVRGEADAYVHAGGQYEWDSAAPVAVAKSQGLWCSRTDGLALQYNQRDVYLPDLVICRPELAEAILEITRRG
ncbi:3'(2'),5'-bisphosphate nucleotidase CysQ [Williamsia sp. 1135]|uniref:3'(2'),5'-bisphosphate nucleotidase CysQ n=1 Tax=Williamsia sp. 1135 TaxID=1889262 RepID=UPI000A118A2F|nr:3'(2'),5'-bisphosphate nucleotidase CysQ [Williamsia sp. 1135]ORM34123.1 3'(2'),5'-bisphosphate nucleotidase CysQ [Williamsia sp. 1135]